MTVDPRAVAFGAVAAAYDRARPPYPEQVWSILVERCGLGPGCRTFEVGPGTGLASRRLRELGARPLVLVEPDVRFRPYLDGFDVVWEPFETAELGDAGFQLGVAATSFHWVDRCVGLPRAAALLAGGGWWAMVWNIHGGPGYEDPLASVVGPLGEGTSPHTLDIAARHAELAAAGFVDIDSAVVQWSDRWSASGARDLYSTFGRIMGLPADERDRVLDAVEATVRSEFAGELERTMTTVLYTARRP
jgi:hypothetical protein